jgi:hypothetical protein
VNYSIWIYSNSAKWIKIDIRNKAFRKALKKPAGLRNPDIAVARVCKRIVPSYH